MSYVHSCILELRDVLNRFINCLYTVHVQRNTVPAHEYVITFINVYFQDNLFIIG